MKLIVSILSAILLFGCGGGGNNSAASDQRANVRFTVQWPDETRLIHQRSNRITIIPSVEEVFQGQAITISKPNTQYVAPYVMPTGPVRFQITAYEASEPTKILSSVDVVRVLTPGTVNDVDFVLESQVASIEIQKNPNKLKYEIGDQFQLTAIGRNQDGAILLNSASDFEFRSSNSLVVLVSSSGFATAIASGTTLISAAQVGNDPSGGLIESTSITVGTGLQGSYQLVDLGTLGGLFHLATGINSAGHVVGYYSGGAFQWVLGRGMVNIHPSGNNTAAQAISDQGQVVGYVEGGANAFAWSEQTGIQFLPLNIAWAVNESGIVAGDSSTLIGESHAFRWSATGGKQDLGSLRGSTGISSARGVNDNGTIVGYSIAPLPSTNICAFVWTPGSGMSQLSLPGGESKAWAINNSGEIVGEFTNGGQTRAFCWSPTHGLTDIGAIMGSPNASVAYAINNFGDVVGNGGTGPFIWSRSGGLRRVSDQIDSSGTGWTVLGINAINDNRWIAGTGLNPSGQVRGFVLVPN